MPNEGDDAPEGIEAMVNELSAQASDDPEALRKELMNLLDAIPEDPDDEFYGQMTFVA